jgi:hypothetical protein
LRDAGGGSALSPQQQRRRRRLRGAADELSLKPAGANVSMLLRGRIST